MSKKTESKYNVSCVMPAYNEQDNIEKAVNNAIGALERFASEYEIIVVDDGSTDNTFDILMRLTSTIDNLKVIRHGENKGYGAALNTGFRSAGYDLIFYTDSDNQFDMNDISLLLNVCENADIVAGYREKRKDTKSRLLSSKVYNNLVCRLFGISMIDINCAFKLFKKSVFDTINVSSTDFFIDAEIMIKAYESNMTIVEVPVTHHPRLAGKSTVKSSDILTTLISLKKLKREMDGFGKK